ncbi:hypothetical protein FGO68_gene14173 [Halteria grandinella]|uniref:Uncharacterized protein n=1 Tax=Halteria grandinella TaxID=5974 RepID=A0A8J8NMT7_HALGN|nr:hypothetical protein FGO68_gene14173 [Halteria grandinella]
MHIKLNKLQNMSLLSTEEFLSKPRPTRSLWSSLSSTLSIFSVGRYQTTLSYQKRQVHASILGSFSTLILAVIILMQSVFILRSIYNREQYSVKSQYQTDLLQYRAREFTEMLNLKITIFQSKEYPLGQRNESLNICGGYICWIEDDIYTEGAPCVKQILANNGTVSYAYYIYPKISNTTVNLGSLSKFLVTCECVDTEVCFSNNTPPGGNEPIKQPDIFDLKYNSYFFDNIKDALSKRVQVGPLILNSSVTSLFKPFSILKTDSIVQIDPLYKQYDYAHFDQADSSIIISENLTQEEYLNKLSIEFLVQNIYEEWIQYQLTPQSLAHGLAQIGGLLSLMGFVMVGLRYYHRKGINKGLQKYLDSQNCPNQQAIDFYSFENFTQALKRIHVQEQKLQAYETELKTLKVLIRGSNDIGVGGIQSMMQTDTPNQSYLI